MTQPRDIDWSKHRLWTADKIRTERRELDLADWGLPIEIETRRRIRLAIAAYAYEILDRPIMEDDEFDQLAQSIQRQQGTCHPLVDEFFAAQFSPMTGMWIHDHPELAKIKALYQTHYARR